MMYEYIGKIAVEYGMLGVVVPGQKFDVQNDAFLDIFEGPLFKKLKEAKKVNKKVAAKEDDCPGCPDKKEKGE